MLKPLLSWRTFWEGTAKQRAFRVLELHILDLVPHDQRALPPGARNRLKKTPMLNGPSLLSPLNHQRNRRLRLWPSWKLRSAQSTYRFRYLPVV